jgi:archaellum component FlaC
MFSGVDSGATSIFGKIFKYLRQLGFTLMDNLMGDVKAAMKPAFDAMDRVGEKFGEARDKAAAAAADMKAKFAAAFAGMNVGSLDQIITDLKAKTGAMGGDFDKAFDAFNVKFTKNFSMDGKVLQEWKDKIKAAIDADEELNTHLADDPFRFKDKDKDKKDKGDKSPFEALDQIRRRIEDAAASPEAEATNKQSELMKKLHDQSMGKMDKLIDAVDPEKRSAKEKLDINKLRDSNGLFRLGNGMGF